MSRGRYMTNSDFGRLLGDLRITQNIFQDGLLAFLEEQRLVVPVARVSWPHDLIREQHGDTSTAPSSDAVRTAALSLDEAVRGYNGWQIDPNAEHPYDAPSSAQFVEHDVANTPFRKWDMFTLWVTPPDRERHKVDGAIETLYHDWQALFVADAIEVGVHFLINMSTPAASNAWLPFDKSAIAALPAHVTRSLQSERGLHDGKKWAYALDASARAQIAQDRALASISAKHTGPSRYLDDAEKAALTEMTEKAAKAELARAKLDEAKIYEFITYLCERWDEWSRRDRQIIAGEYKRHINRALGLLVYGLGHEYPAIVERLGRVTGHFANTLEEVFPDKLKDRREKLRLSLQHSVVKKAPATDPDFVLADSDVTDLLDWTERNRFLKLHSSVDAILEAQFKGNPLDHAALAKEVESLSSTFEHMTNVLLDEANQVPSGTTLKPKLTKLWQNVPEVTRAFGQHWGLTNTNPPNTLAGQLSAISALSIGPREEVIKAMLVATLYRNEGLHKGVATLSEDDLHKATSAFLLAMMYLRKQLLRDTHAGGATPASVVAASPGSP